MALVRQHSMSDLRWSKKTRSRMSAERCASSILMKHKRKRLAILKMGDLKRQYRELMIIVSMWQVFSMGLALT